MKRHGDGGIARVELEAKEKTLAHGPDDYDGDEREECERKNPNGKNRKCKKKKKAIGNPEKYGKVAVKEVETFVGPFQGTGGNNLIALTTSHNERKEKGYVLDDSMRIHGHGGLDGVDIGNDIGKGDDDGEGDGRPDELTEVLARIQREYNKYKFVAEKFNRSKGSLERLVRSRSTKCFDMWSTRFEGRHIYRPDYWRNRVIDELIVLTTVNKTRIKEISSRNGEHSCRNKEDKDLVSEFLAILEMSRYQKEELVEEVRGWLDRLIHVFCGRLSEEMGKPANGYSGEGVEWYGHDSGWKRLGKDRDGLELFKIERKLVVITAILTLHLEAPGEYSFDGAMCRVEETLILGENRECHGGGWKPVMWQLLESGDAWVEGVGAVIQERRGRKVTELMDAVNVADPNGRE